jgi:hypothetical protein
MYLRFFAYAIHIEVCVVMKLRGPRSPAFLKRKSSLAFFNWKFDFYLIL